MMDQQRYVGKIDRLQGKTALVRKDPERTGGVLAQFDEIYLYKVDAIGQTMMDNCLWVGWHQFSADDFEKIDDEPDWRHIADESR